MTPPEGYKPLPTGIRCRCPGLWVQPDGVYWCCALGTEKQRKALNHDDPALPDYEQPRATEPEKPDAPLYVDPKTNEPLPTLNS